MPAIRIYENNCSCQSLNTSSEFRRKSSINAHFRNRFYRCTDPWGAGNYRKFQFECPAGTVFDESISVCNWPQQSAPCDEDNVGGGGLGLGGVGEGSEVGLGGGDDEDDFVVVSPSFSFQVKHRMRATFTVDLGQYNAVSIIIIII
jgi:hypothetical protein